ncbi:MAG: divalent-cation tolerance protein CutA [Planctomycetales bacterium]
MTEHLVVTTTVNEEEAARRIANALVETRLAACVQVIGPIHSVYRWEDEVQAGEEWLCLIKTSEECYEDLERSLKELHPYDVPQVIALPIVAGSGDYLNWLADQLRSS